MHRHFRRCKIPQRCDVAAEARGHRQARKIFDSLQHLTAGTAALIMDGSTYCEVWVAI